jgi:hypothetical protein
MYVMDVDRFAKILIGSSVSSLSPAGRDSDPKTIWWTVKTVNPAAPSTSGTNVCHEDQEYIVPPQERAMSIEVEDETKRKEPT